MKHEENGESITYSHKDHTHTSPSNFKTRPETQIHTQPISRLFMENQQESPPRTSAQSSTVNDDSQPFLLKLLSKRRTWVFLFISVYAVLLSLSWNLIKAVLRWYELNSSSPSSSSSSTWRAMYASVLLGLAFGVLSVVAALAVAVPATLVTWITVLVLLTFCGKPRKVLVVEGKKLTAEITWSVIRVLIKEGNVVAAICAVLGYFALFRKDRENGSRSSIFDFE